MQPSVARRIARRSCELHFKLKLRFRCDKRIRFLNVCKVRILIFFRQCSDIGIVALCFGLVVPFDKSTSKQLSRLTPIQYLGNNR